MRRFEVHAGLIALPTCGHWWVYPSTRMTAEQMHDLARFNAGVVCSFCLTTRENATLAGVRGTATRVN
jgi:hypothetical protein